MRRPVLALTALVATAAVALPAGAATTKTVVVKDFAFSPETVRVRKGDSVAWRFRDGSIPHDVTGAGGIRSPRNLRQGATYRKRFTTRGTFKYVCKLHPGMDGRVVVR